MILDRYFSSQITVAKVLEGIVQDWLMPSLDPFLDENQSGCRSGGYTTHTLIAVLRKLIANQNPVLPSYPT